MQSAKTLRRPANWQDFETLCLKLWGEIWNCREIVKNGRMGQIQYGVDVYGVPEWDDQYYGIQCKGKDEYTNSQFTKREIDEEIEKAKQFSPKLKKLYFATTAVKDAAIEEHVRKANLKHKQENLFEVHLFSWEDIVDKIDENRQTHDWYVKNRNFKTVHAVKVTFCNGLDNLTLKPKFRQSSTVYRKSWPKIETLADKIQMGMPNLSTLQSQLSTHYNTREINLSYVGFQIKIENSGREPIENYKVLLTFKGEIYDMKDENVKGGMLQIIHRRKKHSTFLNPEDKTAKIVPFNPLLVSEDKIFSEEIYLKPSPIETQIVIAWKLLSRDFKSGGELILNLDTEITPIRKTLTVDDIHDERIENGDFSDFVEIINDNKY
ncbi:hypothetical protein OKW96_16355 [Sphingobacterium sp. KU25419]|nr:hypothetical protein OKW96_16355 [Sphingobacterium sp. KU25419]